ncbi:GAF domain-containing protein [Marinicella gelatinilytica]|uniref:GAF domain-containing protein n=1 Tax=Marinicella gelatinilytica TaxID=2996017 RepID=UPI002260F126|nr:GAF domain-containing protein [Marinicella gelatinilytica]MCX7545879.1 GAF domain-containing protein [Marinicella gelatinilytica]
MNSNHDLLLQQLAALLKGEHDPLANAANLSAFLYHSLDAVNWLGFYFQQGDELVLGPFHGQPACTRLPIGQGVCGKAFANKQSLTVADVSKFSGHIYCDTASQSEVVVPFYHDKMTGVLDVDSPDLNRFDQQDTAFFEQVVRIYGDSISH